MKQPRPLGRAQVVRALLDAGASMLAEKGPNELSVRGVAERAGVNHGLVHRHFGTKQGFVRAIVDDLADQLHAARARGEPIEGLKSLTDSQYIRVLARCLLDGMDMPSIQTRFPVMRELREQFDAMYERGELRSDATARVLLAMTVALGMGWILFEPFLMSSIETDEKEYDAIRSQATLLWNQMMRASD